MHTLLFLLDGQIFQFDFYLETVRRFPSKSNESYNQDTETDFTAYSRLCQDLVNLIEGQNDMEVKSTEEIHVRSELPVIDVSNDNNKTEKFSLLRIQSLGNHYSENNIENHKDKENIEKQTEIFTKFENENCEKTDDNTFDFYLRVADENVKLIAEAFSSVADHLRDSRLSQKNSLTSYHSEIETDSTAPNTSTRSSITCSQDDTNDDLSSSSRITDILNVVPKEDTTITLNEDCNLIESEKARSNSHTDPKLDLSKAVYDLQLAAASLCKHEKEIESKPCRPSRPSKPCSPSPSVPPFYPSSYFSPNWWPLPREYYENILNEEYENEEYENEEYDYDSDEE